MINPRPDGPLEFATLALELQPVASVIDPLVSRVQMLDQIYPFDPNRSGLINPVERVWECFLDYLLSFIRVTEGADAEMEFDTFCECAFSEMIFSYLIDEIPDGDQRYVTTVTEFTSEFNRLIEGFLLPKMAFVRHAFAQQGKRIAYIQGHFARPFNRLLLELYLEPIYAHPTPYGVSSQFNRPVYPECVL